MITKKGSKQTITIIEIVIIINDNHENSDYLLVSSPVSQNSD